MAKGGGAAARKGYLFVKFVPHIIVVDVRIARRYGGADSTWFDFFSVAKGLKRQT